MDGDIRRNPGNFYLNNRTQLVWNTAEFYTIINRIVPDPISQYYIYASIGQGSEANTFGFFYNRMLMPSTVPRTITNLFVQKTPLSYNKQYEKDLQVTATHHTFRLIKQHGLSLPTESIEKDKFPAMLKTDPTNLYTESMTTRFTYADGTGYIYHRFIHEPKMIDLINRWDIIFLQLIDRLEYPTVSKYGLGRTKVSSLSNSSFFKSCMAALNPFLKRAIQFRELMTRNLPDDPIYHSLSDDLSDAIPKLKSMIKYAPSAIPVLWNYTCRSNYIHAMFELCNMLLDPRMPCRTISESRLISLIRNETTGGSVFGAFQTKKPGALKIAQTIVESQYYLEFFKEYHDTPKLTDADRDEIQRLKIAFDATISASAASNVGGGSRSGAAAAAAAAPVATATANNAAGVGLLPARSRMRHTRKSRHRFRMSRRERRSTKY